MFEYRKPTLSFEDRAKIAATKAAAEEAVQKLNLLLQISGMTAEEISEKMLQMSSNTEEEDE